MRSTAMVRLIAGMGVHEQGFREVVTSGEADLGRGLQIGEFLEALDAFSDNDHSQRATEGFDRAQDTLVTRSFMNVGDEAAIDFHLVGGDVRERGQ